MKTFEYVERRTREQASTVCDKCLQEFDGPEGMYEVFDCELQIRTGYHFPGSDDTERLTMDLCPTCTIALQELLATNGYRLNSNNK